MKRSNRSYSFWLGIPMLGLLAVPGCALLKPFALITGEKKKVTAEFDKLAGHPVAVLVWTDQSTQFDYPHARLELASYLADKLSTEMTQRELGVQIVSPRDVENYLQKNPSAQIDPAKVGKEFKADFVVYVEVVEFQFRSPDQPQLLQGKINASVFVYDTRLTGERSARYTLEPINCTFPETAPVLMSATNSMYVREATYQQFAEQIARKFYAYTIEL